MQCDQCDNIAEVHITDIINGKKSVMNLCNECAEKIGSSIDLDVDMHGLVGKLAKALPMKDEKQVENPTCNVCGISYEEFRSSGRLSCPNDYVVFNEVLKNICNRIHNGTTHMGKVPGHAGQTLDQQVQLIQVRKELNDAIQREEYERAAELRDRIKNMEQDKSNA